MPAITVDEVLEVAARYPQATGLWGGPIPSALAASFVPANATGLRAHAGAMGVVSKASPGMVHAT
eukprot:1708538-Prorocentrum_lima.AAC.1